MRAKFLARLGPEAADPLDEFLNLALAYDDAAPPSLTGFLAYLREMEREVKRDMEHGRDEVRVMTVHGAKGLEAPIVFLPDTCTTAAVGGGLLELAAMELPQRRGGDAVRVGRQGHEQPRSRSGGARQKRTALDAEERHRLLYVAMTRARDRLYVAGFEGKKRPRGGCWYDLIGEGAARDACHGNARRRRTGAAPVEPQSVPRSRRGTRSRRRSRLRRLPPWALRGAPREPALDDPARALAARSLCARRDRRAAAGQPRAPDGRPSRLVVLAASAAAGEDRFLRGTLTHALLQHLPTLPQAGWETAAKGFLASAGGALMRAQREVIATGDARNPHAPQFARLFGPAEPRRGADCGASAQPQAQAARR